MSLQLCVSFQCAIYRNKCDNDKRARMSEKVTASDLFKDKKECYPQT